MTRLYNSSRPCHWVSPRPHTDECQRRHTYGPLRSGETSLATDIVAAALIVFTLVALFGGAW